MEQINTIENSVTNLHIPSTEGTKITIMKQLLIDLPDITKVDFVRSITSSVTTKWGVQWDEELIARDIIQNFRDANLDNINEVEIKINKDLVCVKAVNEFDLRELFFVGSNKKDDPNTIGQYGEGFKAAIVSMIKMGIDCPISISGDMACIISVGDQVDSDLDLRPLVYNFFKINKLKGSYFYINTYNDKLKNAFKFGLKNFWYAENPLVGEELHNYNDISFYKSNTKDGYIFYSGIKRTEIKGIPLIININKKYAAIEKKISSDRDRNSFDDRLTQSLYKIIFSSGFYYATGFTNNAINYIFKVTKKLWSKGSGHPLLKAIADNMYNLNRDDDDKNNIKILFDDKYYCESSWKYAGHSARWWESQPEIALMDRDFKTKNKIQLPSYFSRFGVKSSMYIITERREEIEKEAKSKATKKLTKNESEALSFCLNCVKEMAPDFRLLFSDISDGSFETSDGRMYNITYNTVNSKVLLGELRDSNSTYGDKIIYLNKTLFSSSFGVIFSTLLHEMCHVFGRDGDRQFTDALTRVMEKIINNSNIITKFSHEWESFKS
tara:strand:- start:1238 stop:2896 length:1659 start_codon:yes stop_codon:yes gene_type:complete